MPNAYRYTPLSTRGRPGRKGTTDPTMPRTTNTSAAANQPTSTLDHQAQETGRPPPAEVHSVEAQDVGRAFRSRPMDVLSVELVVGVRTKTIGSCVRRVATRQFWAAGGASELRTASGTAIVRIRLWRRARQAAVC